MERKFVGRALGLAVVSCALLGAVSAASADIVIPTVAVGNPGNAADSTGYGAVGYAYRIGTDEVTAGQYTAFLNAVAGDGYLRPVQRGHGGTDFRQRHHAKRRRRADSHTRVDPAFVNRPVNYVSFWDACRFANWLNNGQGRRGHDRDGGVHPDAPAASPTTR